jgi:hypothetical protein
MFGLFGVGSRYNVEDLIAPKSKANPLADIEPDVEFMKLRLDISTRLGWITWKETEASLFRLLETCFGASSCSIELTDALNRIILTLEIPSEHFPRFKKAFKSRTLPLEIGKRSDRSRIKKSNDLILYR